MDVPEADLYICGLGLQVPNDLSLETIEIFRRVKVAFLLPAVDLTEIAAGLEVRDLTKHYSENTDRLMSYQKMADEVLAEAMLSRPLAFATYGHPIVGTNVTGLIQTGAARYGYSIHIGNAPSSIEAVCALIGIDPFHGLQLWDATDFVFEVQAWDPRFWLFLTQVPYIGIRTARHHITGPRHSSNAITALQSRLSAVYGAAHSIAFVRAPVLGHAGVIQPCQLSELSSSVPQNAATLVIPPLHRQSSTRPI